jgi:hypothetical protein
VERRVKRDSGTADCVLLHRAGFVPFLQKLGTIARKHAAVLYYPAAGDDLWAALTVGTDISILVDSSYFRRGRARLGRRALKRSVRKLDASATFDDRRDVLTARLRYRSRQRTFVFVRAANGRQIAQVRTIAPRGCVYLVKGTLQPEVLCPSPALVEALRPCAYGLDLLHLPSFSARVLRAYHTPLFSQASHARGLLIFRGYTPDVRRVATLRRQLDRLAGD